MFKGIIDTTLRDGQQSPLLFDSYKYRFTLEDKKKLVRGLINVGVTYLEFFSPVVSTSERKEFIEIKKYISSLTEKKIMLLSHCRCDSHDIDAAMKVGFDGINLYMNGTKKARTHGYKKSLTQLKQHIKKTIIDTKKKYPNVYIRFSIEDAFRTAASDMYAIFDQLYDHVDTFGIPDTVGMATPELVTQRITNLKKRYPDIDFECHFHNDRGYALINTITAIQAGVAYADTSIWGLAERSGIASTTGVLFNLHELGHSYAKKFNLNLCYPLNVLMGSLLKMQVPYNEPVSITNRTHIAGVHHKAVLKAKSIYEAHHLEEFGVTNNQMLLGPLSGWNLIYYYLKEFENYDVSEMQAKAITVIFKDQAKKIHKKFKPENLLKRIAEEFRLAKNSLQKSYLTKRIENLD